MKTTKETATVNYLGFDFDLEGNYSEAESENYDYYGCAANFEINKHIIKWNRCSNIN